MPAFALPWVAPAAGEGLLWGAGALGTGLAALGIIENKDAIRNGISDFGNWVSTGVQNGIRSWSDAMSPKGPVGPNPNYDVATGRPIAVQDATRVQMPLLRQPIQPRPFGATRSTRYDSDGEPILFPWQAGSPEKPVQLRPVTVMGSRVMRTDAEGAQPAQPTSTSEGSSTSAPAPANPEPEQDNSNNSENSTNQRGPSFRERLGDRIAGRNRGQASTGGNTPPNNNQEGPFLQRMLWETKNNNFGQNWWQWRNVGRVGLGLSYPARETVWPAVGKGLKYMAVGPDSVPTPAVPQAAPAQPVTTPTDTVPGQAQPDSTSYNSFDAELEELRKAYGGN